MMITARYSNLRLLLLLWLLLWFAIEKRNSSNKYISILDCSDRAAAILKSSRRYASNPVRLKKKNCKNKTKKTVYLRPNVIIYRIRIALSSDYIRNNWKNQKKKKWPHRLCRGINESDELFFDRLPWGVNTTIIIRINYYRCRYSGESVHV